MALKNKVVRGVIAEIELPDGATLETGKAREECGQLEGRSHVGPTGHPRSIGSQPAADRLKVEWVVHAPDGGSVTVTARHERAGTVRVDLVLKP